MNLKLDLKDLNFGRVLKGFIKVLPILALLLAGSAIGFSLFRLNQVISVDPDPAMVESERAAVAERQIHFDVKTIDSVNKLTPVNAPVDLTNLGKTDPFSP